MANTTANSSETLPAANELGAWQTLFFKDLKSKGRSTNTLKNYRTDLDCFNSYLREGNHRADLSRFSIGDVQAYGAYLDERYSSDNSRRRRVQALRLFFDFLVANGMFANNPVRKLPTSPKFLDVPRPTPFSEVKTLWEFLLAAEQAPEELNRLIALRNQVVVLMIYGAGLKVSDLSSLKIQRLSLSSENPRVLIEHPKRDPYTIPLPEIFIQVWERYQKAVAQEKERAGLNFDEVLFAANPHRILAGGLSARGMEVIFEDIRKKLMITLTPKSLRQACIFKWLKQGINDTTIKEWLGVAPSYSLKPYRESLKDHIYGDEFLKELWLHQQRRRGGSER
tara:strand:+ start:912 stop:1925 length:1014 start_codon:yes stop_codon:yes gene_type:complete